MKCNLTESKKCLCYCWLMTMSGGPHNSSLALLSPSESPLKMSLSAISVLVDEPRDDLEIIRGWKHSFVNTSLETPVWPFTLCFVDCFLLKNPPCGRTGDRIERNDLWKQRLLIVCPTTPDRQHSREVIQVERKIKKVGVFRPFLDKVFFYSISPWDGNFQLFFFSTLMASLIIGIHIITRMPTGTG